MRTMHSQHLPVFASQWWLKPMHCPNVATEAIRVGRIVGHTLDSLCGGQNCTSWLRNSCSAAAALRPEKFMLMALCIGSLSNIAKSSTQTHALLLSFPTNIETN